MNQQPATYAGREHWTKKGDIKLFLWEKDDPAITARKGTILREAQQWTLFGCTFSGIAADDYDALVRFCKDMHEVGNKAAEQLASMDKTDDAYRMLPMRVQQHVLDALIRLGRLDMPQPNQQPGIASASLSN